MPSERGTLDGKAAGCSNAEGLGKIDSKTVSTFCKRGSLACASSVVSLMQKNSSAPNSAANACNCVF
jgi:hypothetical protein